MRFGTLGPDGDDDGVVPVASRPVKLDEVRDVAQCSLRPIHRGSISVSERRWSANRLELGPHKHFLLPRPDKTIRRFLLAIVEGAVALALGSRLQFIHFAGGSSPIAGWLEC